MILIFSACYSAILYYSGLLLVLVIVLSVPC